MIPQNPIVIVEDDMDDCRFLTEALEIVGVKNPLRCFDNVKDVLEYLRKTKETPFLIISDINMPVINGIEFKKAINSDKKVSLKNIPFIFLSTLPPSTYNAEVEKLSVQGHFKKPILFDELVHIMRSIIESWKRVKAMTG